ncbi:hypothetical protein CAPTEDRAFT_159664 [Capitella teleta]|uniref:Small ribosomal subunit protein uS15m n=1 Tax=Capitella teleta TaxID=283909 RepID=R7TN18_CAPTE|nr:hypothetical protein CAPTEDRAFT_159664 [Capitella teleta]|eukprot:ELT95034.1 hypothetical protein CAPTEDRAFT_159664 [Capitella teleta]
MSFLRGVGTAVSVSRRLLVSPHPCTTDLLSSTFARSVCISAASNHGLKNDGKLLTTSLPCVTTKRWRTRKGTVKIPYTKPLSFEHGGDSEWGPLVQFSKSDPQPGFEGIPELESADERVQRLFSLEFADGRERKQKEMEYVVKALQENPADTSTLESHILRRTVHIRKQIGHCLEFRKDKRSKVKLLEGIQRRHKYLKELRRIDGERFEWLTKELNLKFTPTSELPPKLSKKQRRKNEAREACWAIIQTKLEALKVKLEKEKAEFAEHKRNELKSIETELAELGIEMQPTIEETVKQIDIGREVFKREKTVKRRKALLEKKFELYGLHKRNRGKDSRIKFV